MAKPDFSAVTHGIPKKGCFAISTWKNTEKKLKDNQRYIFVDHSSFGHYDLVGHCQLVHSLSGVKVTMVSKWRVPADWEACDFRMEMNEGIFANWDQQWDRCIRYTSKKVRIPENKGCS